MCGACQSERVPPLELPAGEPCRFFCPPLLRRVAPPRCLVRANPSGRCPSGSPLGHPDGSPDPSAGDVVAMRAARADASAATVGWRQKRTGGWQRMAV
jgi:hypothetical protein